MGKNHPKEASGDELWVSEREWYSYAPDIRNRRIVCISPFEGKLGIIPPVREINIRSME